jgi:hypothetical protein
VSLTPRNKKGQVRLTCQDTPKSGTLTERQQHVNAKELWSVLWHANLLAVG